MPIYIYDARYEKGREALKKFLMDRFDLRSIALDATISRLSIFIPHVGSVSLAQMPEQCGILIAYNLPRPTKTIVEVVETVARIFQYKTVMVSHRVGHTNLSCWLDAGYEPVWENKNSHSGSTITVLIRDIGEQPEEFQELAALIYDCT